MNLQLFRLSKCSEVEYQTYYVDITPFYAFNSSLHTMNLVNKGLWNVSFVLFNRKTNNTKFEHHTFYLASNFQLYIHLENIMLGYKITKKNSQDLPINTNKSSKH